MECRLFVRGEIDLASAAALLADLQRAISASDADLIIDCKHLRFIDSTAVRVLVEAHRALERQGRHLTVVNIVGGPRRVFEDFGLTELTLDDGLIST